MPEFVKVTTVDKIQPGTMKAFVVNQERILICHTERGISALVDECSHDSAPISMGELIEGQVVCPRHGARFDAETGDVTGPPAVVGIDRFEVKIENNEIFVKLD